MFKWTCLFLSLASGAAALDLNNLSEAEKACLLPPVPYQDLTPRLEADGWKKVALEDARETEIRALSAALFPIVLGDPPTTKIKSAWQEAQDVSVKKHDEIGVERIYYVKNGGQEVLYMIDQRGDDSELKALICRITFTDVSPQTTEIFSEFGKSKSDLFKGASETFKHREVLEADVGKSSFQLIYTALNSETISQNIGENFPYRAIVVTSSSYNPDRD